MISGLAKHLPDVTELDHGSLELQAADIPQQLPTTLQAAVRIYTDKKVLASKTEEIDVAIDIEGVLHNSRPLSDTLIDVIFIVDNG